MSNITELKHDDAPKQKEYCFRYIAALLLAKSFHR
jgi:hypothetical protein